jgi:hypothetical protein
MGYRCTFRINTSAFFLILLLAFGTTGCKVTSTAQMVSRTPAKVAPAVASAVTVDSRCRITAENNSLLFDSYSSAFEHPEKLDCTPETGGFLRAVL